MTPVEEIKARIDIVELVSESVRLRKSGKNYTGFCPFHANTRTPAFVVFPETGTWRCFGQCNEGGDIFRFVMKKEGWDFAETLRYLAERAGVTLKAPTPQEQEAAEAGDHLRALLEDAASFYRHHLLDTPAGKTALDYLRSHRHLKDDTIEAFGLGYAPLSWDAALNHFKSKGYSEQDLLDAGLVSVRQAEGAAPARMYDRFRHRIMFPIRDERGRMAGFGARIVNPDDLPKFLNSPQTALFDKSRLLYGLDRARKSIRSLEQAVIVEGYLDVIALHQAGFTNVVSPMGTALSEHQIFLLKKLTRSIVLALDPDAAGDKATLRGLHIARQAMDHTTEAVFDARGLLGYEARLQADIRVTTLPPGLDPDEVVNRDPAEWQRIVAEARPIVIHVMETLAAGKDLNNPKVKSELAAQVMPLIEESPSPIERDTYRQRLARLLRVDERALLSETPRPRRRPAPRQAPLPPQANRPAGQTTLPLTNPLAALETHCLGVLIRRPDMLYLVDRKLQEDGLPRLSAADFHSAEHQTIFQLVQDSLHQDLAEPLASLLNSLSLPLMELADKLLEHTQKVDPSDERVLDDLMRAVLDLRRRNLRQHMDHYRYLIEEAQQNGDWRASEYGQIMSDFTQSRERLDRALGRYTSHNPASHG